MNYSLNSNIAIMNKLLRSAKNTILPLLASLSLLIVCGCKKNDSGENAYLALTTFKIEDPARHYYPIVQGTKQNISIKVTNTGKEPLKIFKVQPSCGCTIATFPESAIAAGEDGFIELEYNSNKNIGYAGIYTTIVANTKDHYHTFFFDINVVPHALYTKDYEELHHEEQEKKLGEGDENKNNQRPYEVDTSRVVKFNQFKKS